MVIRILYPCLLPCSIRGEGGDPVRRNLARMIGQPMTESLASRSSPATLNCSRPHARTLMARSKITPKFPSRPQLEGEIQPAIKPRRHERN